MRGSLITIEGPDGSGKTRNAERLCSALRDAGHRVALTREPTPRASELLACPGLTPLQRAAVYAADRAQHVATWINTQIADGVIVVCDRGPASNLVHLAASIVGEVSRRGDRITYARALEDAEEALSTLESPWPSGLTILLDAPDAALAQRIRERGASASAIDRDDLLQTWVRGLYRDLSWLHVTDSIELLQRVSTDTDPDRVTAALVTLAEGAL